MRFFVQWLFLSVVVSPSSAIHHIYFLLASIRSGPTAVCCW